ncbi:redoxin domain-containing protein [Pedobacter cryoconitis]|uniref:Peroxiredoxin n=1 Tax=Pedobacter cryoconitis TaxID=188932 RepID=A0A327SLZ3_9SPHI|nr:redoxin domain-containing protein [Pedobacter cryoconitis]RAJ28573.1 peroxiredoxin [Pedobacter cryoconitis]
MKRIVLSLLVFSVGISGAAAQQKGFTIKGEIKGLHGPAKVYLDFYEGKISDSAVVRDGSFQFKGIAKKTGLADLILDRYGVGKDSVNLENNTDELTFFLDNSEITVTAQDSLIRGTVTGSRINDEYMAYNKFIGGTVTAAYKNHRNRISPYLWSSYPFFKEFDEYMYQFKAERFEKQLQFIHENPQSYFSLFALKDITLMGYGKDMIRTGIAYRSIDAKLRNSPEGQRIGRRIQTMSQGAVGTPAPDFTLYDVNGKAVKLSAYRGNYVVLYFWVTGNDLIKAENYKMIKAAGLYKHKKFKIISISLDPEKRKQAWAKEVKENKLPWVQVWGVKSGPLTTAKLYGTQGTPSSIVIDPDGMIVTRDLNGIELQYQLAEYMK